MANELIANYAEHLRNKFPQCEISIHDFPHESLISVKWKKGGNWFEMPALFKPGIPQLVFDEAGEELTKWEDVIALRLENDGNLPD